MKTITPGYWRQKNGKKCEVVEVREGGACGYDSDGSYSGWDLAGRNCFSRGRDLDKPWQDEPMVKEYWDNIYFESHATKECADAAALPGRIDCRHVRYTQGIGIEDITDGEPVVDEAFETQLMIAIITCYPIGSVKFALKEIRKIARIIPLKKQEATNGAASK